jgi:hypothetical protein
MPVNALPHEVERVVLALCEDLATPITLSVAIQIRNGCWDNLASMRVDPKHYLDSDADRFWRDAVAVDLLRKNQDLPTSFDREAKALENFWKSEHECFRTNQRLLPFLGHGVLTPQDEAIQRIIRRIGQKVAAILGPCPDLLDGRFGPGATYGDKGRFTTVPDKMSSRPTLTRSAMWYLLPWGGTAWATACANASRDPEFVRGNRFTTVPKDCTKDRGIAVEPSINLFYQLAYGRVMKRRLSDAGLDQQKAQVIHRQVACEASIKGHLATIDLSNASDTVCTNLVELVLPSRWFEVLADLRSRCTALAKGWVHNEKFSSMGNGFTFELETTIFAAICMVAMEDGGVDPLPGVNLFVFGDDIIVPSSCARNVIAVLRYLGFSPNERKTFSEGPFRESCGGDYFSGSAVRPHYLESNPREAQEYIAFANGLYRAACEGDTINEKRFALLRRAWFGILDALPSHIRRLRGPQGLGDVVVHDAEERWNVRWRHSIRYIRCYKPATFKVIGWNHWRPDVVLASALYGVGDGMSEHVRSSEFRSGRYGVTPRDAVTGYKVGWVSYS